MRDLYVSSDEVSYNSLFMLSRFMSEKMKRIFLSCLVVDTVERVFVIYLTRAVAIRMRVCGN